MFAVGGLAPQFSLVGAFSFERPSAEPNATSPPLQPNNASARPNRRSENALSSPTSHRLESVLAISSGISVVSFAGGKNNVDHFAGRDKVHAVVGIDSAQQ